jgi:hypothetical protein
MSTEAQIAANRRNALLSTGPRTEEGKAASRLNARKHGIFAAALTEKDHEELRGIHQRMVESLRPEGALEEVVVEKIALTCLRLQRCARAEAEYYGKVWEELPRLQPGSPRRRKGEPPPPPPPPPPPAYRFHPEAFERLISVTGRYDTTLTNQLLKLIGELRRLRRCGEAMRGGAADGQAAAEALLAVMQGGGAAADAACPHTATLQNEANSGETEAAAPPAPAGSSAAPLQNEASSGGPEPEARNADGGTRPVMSAPLQNEANLSEGGPGEGLAGPPSGSDGLSSPADGGGAARQRAGRRWEDIEREEASRQWLRERRRL